MEPHRKLSFDPSSYNKNSQIRRYLHYANQKYESLISSLPAEEHPPQKVLDQAENWFAKSVITRINWDLLEECPSVELQIALADTLQDLPCSFKLNAIFTTRDVLTAQEGYLRQLIHQNLPIWHKVNIHRHSLFGLRDIVVLAVRRNQPKKTGLTSNKRSKLRHRIAITHPSLRCVYCGTQTTFDAHNKFTLDHIVPNSVGGVWDVANLTLACSSCNNERSDTNFHEYLTYKRELTGYCTGSVCI